MAKTTSHQSKIIAIKRITGIAIVVMLSFLNNGCATQKKIDIENFAHRKTVAIVDIPKMKTAALIGVFVTHFTDTADYFFDQDTRTDGRVDAIKTTDHQSQAYSVAVNQLSAMSRRSRIASAAAISAIGGASGTPIQVSTEETNKRAIGFNDEVLKRFPDFDLRADFLKSLRNALDSKGVGVSLVGDGQVNAPRRRWPDKDGAGRNLQSGTFESSPAVDVDLLMQVSPIAYYRSPGPMNSYRRGVSVSVVIYNGRTQQFIGAQTFRFKASDSKFEYRQYDELLEHLPVAAPGLRDALLSLVPLVADFANSAPSDRP